jgi:hypothetical protein
VTGPLIQINVRGLLSAKPFACALHNGCGKTTDGRHASTSDSGSGHLRDRCHGVGRCGLR